MTRIPKALVWPLALLVSFGAGWGACLLSGGPRENAKDVGVVREEDKAGKLFALRLDEGTFTLPLLDCETDPRQDASRKLLVFGNQFHEYCKEVEKRAGMSRIGVYFRDLENGPWLGYKEKELFRPAGVDGLPLVIAFLRQAEANPQLLDAQAAFLPPGTAPPALRYAPRVRYVPGQHYAAMDLVKIVLRTPDGEAARMLATLVDPNILARTLKDINPELESGQDRRGEFSTLGLGRFFRVLFNASYLQHTLSESVLGSLIESPFSKGLVAGNSPDVIVSHKYGEAAEGTPSAPEIALHDCGIVFSPSKPYLLCVMTSGTDYLAQESAIRDIASFVNAEVMAQAKKE